MIVMVVVPSGNVLSLGGLATTLGVEHPPWSLPFSTLSGK
jgi:hypothetical protein